MPTVPACLGNAAATQSGKSLLRKLSSEGLGLSRPTSAIAIGRRIGASARYNGKAFKPVGIFRERHRHGKHAIELRRPRTFGFQFTELINCLAETIVKSDDGDRATGKILAIFPNKLHPCFTRPSANRSGK